MNDLSRWPALVLTAGLATRLRPLSDVRAKAAMPLAGTPLVGRILEWLRAAGVRRVVLNLHHRPETIARVVGDGAEWDLQARYSWEPRLLGSAGGPRHALPLLDADRFLIVNGDTLTDCPLGDVARAHLDAGAKVTMALVRGDVDRYGGVLVDDRDVVRGFGNASSDARAFHFIGVQAVESEVFADLADNEPCETVRSIYPQLIAEGGHAVRAFVSDAEFLDVGTAADYLSTVITVAAREGKSLDRGHDCVIAPEARLENTILWDRVVVGAGSQLVNCVIADDVKVPQGARYERCTLVAREEGLAVASF